MEIKDKKPLIIGISGKMGSGKDTFAEEFAKLRRIKYNLVDVERHAFADKVRETTQLITGYPLTLTHKEGDPFVNKVYNYTQEQKNYFLKTFGMSIGTALQIIGTEAMRVGFHEETWVISLFETVGKRCLSDGNILIIPDVRFPNEADYILDNNGILLRLEGDPLDIRKNTTRDINHISETALDNYKKFNYVLRNGVADLDVFRNKILTFMEIFLK